MEVGDAVAGDRAARAATNGTQLRMFTLTSSEDRHSNGNKVSEEFETGRYRSRAFLLHLD